LRAELAGEHPVAADLDVLLDPGDIGRPRNVVRGARPLTSALPVSAGTPTESGSGAPARICLRHKSVQRWNLPDGLVISSQRAHEALVSEADFIAATGQAALRALSSAGSGDVRPASALKIGGAGDR
jgi:hypothetical protein